jgi:hypothetical protein
VLANNGFAAIFAAPKLAGLRQLVRIEAEGRRYGSPNNGPSEATIWQLQADKFERCWGEIAGCSYRAQRRSSLLAAAIVITFQATFLAYH